MLRSGSIRPDRPDLFAIFRRCRHFGRRVDRPRSIPPYLCACCPARYPRSRSPDLARRPQAQTLSPAPAQLRTPFPEPQSRPPGPQPPDGADTLFGPRNEHHPKTQTQHRPVAPERRLSPIRPPKRTPPENTEAAPSRNLRTPPAPIRPTPKRTPSENTDAAPSRNLRTPPAPHSAPETNTARKHRRGTDPQPPPKKTQSSLPEQVPAGMTLIRRDVERHHGTTG